MDKGGMAQGLGNRRASMRIQNQKGGETDWKNVDGVTSDGGTFSAVADGLEPLTEYECVAFCGDDLTDVERFTTEADGAAAQLRVRDIQQR